MQSEVDDYLEKTGFTGPRATPQTEQVLPIGDNPPLPDTVEAVDPNGTNAVPKQDVNTFLQDFGLSQNP